MAWTYQCRGLDMNAIVLPSDNFQPVFDAYKAEVPHFTLALTSHSAHFIADDREKIILVDIPLSLRALGLITQLRREARERVKDIDLVYDRAFYYGYRENLHRASLCYEYDLHAAYLHAIFEIGGISEGLFQKLICFDKNERLAIVGSLATKKTLIEYLHGKIVSTRLEKEEKLCALWNTVVVRVDNKMRDIYFNNEGSLFYWVDAIFTTSRMKIDNARESLSRIISTSNGKIVLTDGRFFPQVQRG